MNKNIFLLILLLAITSLSCTVELVTPEPTVPTVNSTLTVAPRETLETLPVNSSPTALSTVIVGMPPIGELIADDAVRVRDTPEANGVESKTVGALYKGQTVTQVGSCVTVGGAIWVHHVAGWSVARNGSGVYIVGVCE